MQWLIGDISYLWPAFGLTPDLIIYLDQTLDGDNDVNSPRKLATGAVKE